MLLWAAFIERELSGPSYLELGKHPITLNKVKLKRTVFTMTSFVEILPRNSLVLSVIKLNETPLT